MSELKPCPFCGNEPVVEGNLVACNNLNCPTHDNYWTDPMIFTCDQWNTRPIEDALTARNAELEEIDKLRSESVSTLNQANANNEDEIELLEKCIAELNAFIDKLIEAGEKMFTAIIAAADSYDEGMRIWDALVNDWKEREE